MTQPMLDARDIERLTKLAAILIPGTARMPGPRDVESFDDLLQSAADACGLSLREIKAALDAMPAALDWESVRGFAAAQPAQFESLSTIASGAYLMAPAVLERLGFPEDRRNPAGMLDAAEEYETGILEPVIRRGPRFRDPRTAGRR